MPQRSLITACAMILSSVVMACADPSSPANSVELGTIRFVNAMPNGATMDLIVGNTVVRSAIPAGTASDWSLAPRTTSVQAGIRVGSQTLLTQIAAIHARERTLLVVHGIAPTLGVLTGDTETIRMDRANIRVAFAAQNAPLVKAYVQPATQSAFGQPPWGSTQAAYTPPLLTTYYRGMPSTDRLTVMFVEYNPGGSERILAVSPAFDAYSGSAWLVTFDQTPSGYSAIVIQEPVPFLID